MRLARRRRPTPVTTPAIDTDRLAAIKKRLAAASDGPWDTDCHHHLEKHCRCLSCGDNATGWYLNTPSTLDCEDRAIQMYGTGDELDRHEHCSDGPFISFEDANFAAHAREDVLFLMRLVEQLAAARDG